MAIDTSGGHAAMDYAEHQRTYDGFLKVSKIVIAALVALMVGMYIFVV